MGIWVNDLTIVKCNLANIKEFKEAFRRIFKIKDLREIKKILRIKITYNR
jgi:hypothetical protein